MKRACTPLFCTLAALALLSSAEPVWAGIRIKPPRIRVTAPSINLGRGGVTIRLPAVQVTPPGVQIRRRRPPEQPQIQFLPDYRSIPRR